VPIQTESDLIKKFPPYIFARLNAEKLAARHGGSTSSISAWETRTALPRPDRRQIDRGGSGQEVAPLFDFQGIPASCRRSPVVRAEIRVLIDPRPRRFRSSGPRKVWPIWVRGPEPGDRVLVPSPTYPSTITASSSRGASFFLCRSWTGPRLSSTAWRRLSPSPAEAQDAHHQLPAQSNDHVRGPAILQRYRLLGQEEPGGGVHDLAYADIVFDGYRSPSFLSVKGPRTSGSRSSPSQSPTTWPGGGWDSPRATPRSSGPSPRSKVTWITASSPHPGRGHHGPGQFGRRPPQTGGDLSIAKGYHGEG